MPSDDRFKLGSPPGAPSSRQESRDKSTIRAQQGRCANPPKGLRWLMYDGSLEPLRCGRSNRCDYCAMLAAIEAALVLSIDAKLNCPTVGLTTTTRDPDFALDALRKAEQALWRQLRREAEKEKRPRLEYCAFLEWTTGKGTRSGGHRRPHLHHLVKGMPVDHPLMEIVEIVDDYGRVHPKPRLELHVSEMWKRYTKGDAWQVEARPLRTPAGAITYLALHHNKRTQAPPLEVGRVRRLRPSKGYYEEPIADLRKLARDLGEDQRVKIAAKRIVARDLYHEEDEREVDSTLTDALVAALRDMAEHPLELQTDLFTGDVDHDVERDELVRRTQDALRRIRAERPAELVRVQERERVDEVTGVVVREAVAVIGPLTPRESRGYLKDRESFFAEAA